MPAEAPPFAVVLTVHERFPGIWKDFVGRAVNAFASVNTNGMILTSWWRDPGENRRVGGSPESQHLAGLALDITGGERAALANAASAFGLVGIAYERHVHIQYWPAGVLADTGLIRQLYA